MRTIAILGATGSIGTQALDIVRRHPDQFRASCLTAHGASDKLFELVKNEHIVIQMKSFNSASCLPQHKIDDTELIPDQSPLDRLKEQVLDAVMNGG